MPGQQLLVRSWVDRVPYLDAVALVIGVALLRKGAFYRPDDLHLPLIAAALALVPILGRSVWRRFGVTDLLGYALLLGLAAWWYERSVHGGVWPLASQGVGAMIGFAACHAIGRSLSPRRRVQCLYGAVALGALQAAVGIAGVALRQRPLALPAQDYYRLAGTLTYSNASGALLAMLLLATVTVRTGVFRDAALTLVAGGLVATQSRGALLGAALGLVLLWRRGTRDSLWPLGCGAVLGLVVATQSHGPQRQPALLVFALGVVMIGSVRPLVGSKPLLLSLPVAAVCAVPLIPRFEGVFRTRAGTASISDRHAELSAAWEAFRSAAWLGRGPGLRLPLADGRSARFAHNELMQLGVDVGLVGVVLFLLFLAALLWRTKRPSVLGAREIGLSFFVCGMLDFPWHVPALTMIAGLLTAGLPLPRAWDGFERRPPGPRGEGC